MAWKCKHDVNIVNDYNILKQFNLQKLIILSNSIEVVKFIFFMFENPIMQILPRWMDGNGPGTVNKSS